MLFVIAFATKIGLVPLLVLGAVTAFVGILYR